MKTMGMRPLTEKLRDARAERDRFKAALEAIYRLPCGHADNPREDQLMALDLISAQTIAREALATNQEEVADGGR